jgi:hypothetical protein
MTSNTGIGRACKLAVLMALFASQSDMLPGQREIGTIMVERGIVPGCGLVTCIALCTERPGVFIVLGMTGKTILRRFRGDGGRVAILAWDFHVTAVEFENHQVMVKSGRRPGIHQVTFRTVSSEATLMRFIRLVASHAVTGRGLEVCQFPCAGMTAIAIHLHMSTRQHKWHPAVIEMFIVSIHAIMTGEAILPPTLDMPAGKSLFQAAVTFDAGTRIKTGQALGMAVLAYKWKVRRGEGVPA